MSNHLCTCDPALTTLCPACVAEHARLPLSPPAPDKAREERRERIATETMKAVFARATKTDSPSDIVELSILLTDALLHALSAGGGHE